MHCIIIASKSAKFGQPEINIGVIPGAGGSQRLTPAIGKFKAMEVTLSGRFLSPQEAFEAGLVTRIVAKRHAPDLDWLRVLHLPEGTWRLAVGFRGLGARGVLRRRYGLRSFRFLLRGVF